MKFLPTDIEGAYLIEWEPFDDERGYFVDFGHYPRRPDDPQKIAGGGATP